MSKKEEKPIIVKNYVDNGTDLLSFIIKLQIIILLSRVIKYGVDYIL